MNITEDKIRQIFHSISDPYGLMDKLAPQEIARLTELVFVTISEWEEKQGAKPRLSFDQWLPIMKGLIVDALEQSQEVFGYLNLSEMLSMDELLNQIYQAQT